MKNNREGINKSVNAEVQLSWSLSTDDLCLRVNSSFILSFVFPLV